MNHIFKFIFSLSAIIILGACQQTTTYYRYQPISSHGWTRTDTLYFNLPDSLRPTTYELEIGIRHTGKYPYRDLWLELTQLVPDKEGESNNWKEKKDTFHLYLANEKGNWIGSGTTSGHFQLLTQCGQFILPKDSMKTSDNEQENLTSTEKRKKYTFLGQTKRIGAQSKYQLKIIHIMTDSTLQHISDVGIHLYK